MDVTPSDKMFAAMNKMGEALIGEKPSELDHSRGARERRRKWRVYMDVMHQFVGICMREGVNRAIREAQGRKAGIIDGQDRSAVAKAKDDAVAGASIIQMPRR